MKLLHFLFFSLTFLTLTHAQCDRTQDSLALVALYNSTDGPNWTNTWDLNDPIDTWYGVTANNLGCVECLDLDGSVNCINPFDSDGGNNLIGTIPPEIGSFSQLEKLILSRNEISGPLPTEIGQLTELTVLYLRQNPISSFIPTQFGGLVNLKDFNCNACDLNGEIPKEFGDLDNLLTIDLQTNNLEGNLPAELGDMDNILNLLLYGNDLSGQIPKELGNLQKIKKIGFGANELSGEIPPELGQLVTLTDLDLGYNSLSGSIPSELGQLSNLEDFLLQSNALTGSIPAELGNLTSIRKLWADNNKLSGCFSDELMTWCGLSPGWIRFDNNPCLPWLGDFQPFCNGEEQVGAPTDDGDDSNGTNDTLQEDCSCGSILDEICDNGIDDDGDGLVDCDDSDCWDNECIICLQDGLSFADRVLEYNPSCLDELHVSFKDSLDALGMPNWDDSTPIGTGAVSLGNGGSITLEFTDNVLTNSGSDYPDLWIFEIGGDVEVCYIELYPSNQFTMDALELTGISDVDLDGFYLVDTVGGSTSFIDIDGFLPNFGEGDLVFSAIKIIDDYNDNYEDCGQSASTGADIDAVCALSSMSLLTEICDNGIDDDGDGLVDCDDDDVSGLICCQTDLCNDAVDVDGDNIGDACDQDDDNDGILDATECPPVFLSTNTIDEWIAVTGGDEVDVQIGDVFIAEQHYIAANGNQYDLRFELLDKYSSDTIADYRAKIRTSSGGQIGICLDGGIPAQNDHIVYDLSWVESGSVNTGNLSGIPASFDWARIFIRDIDNNSSFFINTDGDTIYIDPNFTDVGGFANTIYNFEAGDLLQSYVLPNGQEVFGVSEPSLDLSNCNGCTISGEMMPFNNASLVHGVVGTRQGSTNRLAQWNFLLGDCRDTDGDGIPDYRDPDSDDDGCTDAVEGGADFSNADTENGFLTGDIDSITGIPLIAENGQFLGTSLLSGIQDPDCFDIEICDNGIDDDGDGLVDCDDDDLSNTCCCLEASAFDIQDIEQCGGNVALNGSNDFTNYQWTDLGTGQLLFTSSSAIFSTSGTYQVSVLDSCDNIIIDSFDINLLQQYELFEDYEFCEGDSILINGEIFDQGGMYDQFFTTSDGCDSIIRIDVLEIPIVETSESYTIFEGENITINTETYNAEGLYTQVLTGQNGCDSILSISIEVLPFGDPEVLVYYDFGNCNPGTSFSEFGPSYPNTLLCGDVTGYLPNGNAHSCTPGVDAGEAICISASTECDVDFNSINKVEFSFGVNPEQGAAIVIPSISFYEKAPEQFEWQNGITGQNNYPTRYAIRVLKDNVEIYSNNSIITNREWTAQTFDFSGVSEFVFSSSSALKIQLFPYCPLGLPTTVSAWDIDEFTVSGYCSSAMRSVQGKIQNISNSDVISQIEVELNIDGNITESLTDDEGVFAFNNFEWETYANLKAHSNREPLNGVSTIDLILMQKHLLGIEPFDSPYKMIAADINSSASVSAIDLVELRKLILGIHSEFPENNSWRFIDAKQSLTIDNPWIFTETIKLSPLSSDMMNENFVGVKVGDVNNSVVANATGVTSENRSNGALTLEVLDKAVVAGETVKVDFMSSDYTDVYGYQFTMNFNGMNVSGITAGANNVTEANIAVTGKNMTMSYHNNVSANVSADDVLFTLEMTATTSGNLSEMITIGSSITKAEAYVGEGLEVINLELGVRTEGTVSIIEGYELYQNEPNPFKGMTQIGFSVPQATTATVTVYDVTGKVVKNLTIDAVKGYNTVQLTRNDLGASAGVLYYQLESGDFTAVKRMIVVE